MADLGTLGGYQSRGAGINILGTDYERATMWGPGGPVDLGGLSDGKWTAACAVNDSGQMILWGTPMGTTDPHAAFWNGDPSSPVIDLGTFGGNESWAFGLNDYGFVVGSADEAGTGYHAFVWDGSERIDLGTLGAYYGRAYAINDQGIIVGWAMDQYAQTHAVEWVPIPEPRTILVVLLGWSLVSVGTSPRKRSLAIRSL